MEIDFNHIQMGNYYFKTFFISSYPRIVGPNWLSPIINFEHSLRISTFYYPVESKVILEKLKRKIGEMEATLYSQIEDRKVVDPTLKVALSDAQQLQDSIAEGSEKYFHYGMYITIYAPNKELLEKYSRNVTSTLAAMNVVAKPATLQQEQGFLSTQPLGLDKLYITRNMDTTSIATTFPFVTSELTMDKGIMYGINMHNKSLVIFDRFQLENANTVVFAKSGAGKSYFVKLEAVRSLMLGTEIIIIDPEREYEDLSKAVNGAYISFSQDKGNKMNPFELSGITEDGDDELRMKLLALHGFFKILFGGLSNVEESILDKALILTYREKGITFDPTTQTKQPPLLEDMYKVLKGMAENEAHDLARRMEKYIIGSGAGIFNEASNFEINNPFTVFSIRDLQEELKPLAMYLMLDFIWTKIKKDKRRRLLIVDEAWYMMQSMDSANFMYSIAKRARKYYLKLSTITQDVADFLNNDMEKQSFPIPRYKCS
jgi:type IV secretory pathway VirB4 component